MFQWLKNMRSTGLIRNARQQFALRNWEAASIASTEAIKLVPSSWVLFLYRGWCHFELNRLVDARTDAEHYLANAPLKASKYHAAAYNLRSQIFRKANDKNAALTDISQAISLDPQANYYLIRAIIHGELNQRPLMIEDFRTATQSLTGDSRRFRVLARILCCSPHPHERDGAQALQLSTRACEVSRWRDWISLSILAAAHAECGDFSKAIQWAEKALELAPPEEKNTRQARVELYRRGEPFRDTIGETSTNEIGFENRGVE